MCAPGRRGTVRIVVDKIEGRISEAGRQEVSPVVVRYAQRALERDAATWHPYVPPGIGKSAGLFSVQSWLNSPGVLCVSDIWPLPITVSNLAGDVLNRVIGRVFQLPEQLCEQLRPVQDDLLKVAGDLARHGEQQVRVLAQFLGQAGDGGFRGGRDLVSLDFAQVGRFDADALRQLAYREGAVPV